LYTRGVLPTATFRVLRGAKQFGLTARNCAYAAGPISPQTPQLYRDSHEIAEAALHGPSAISTTSGDTLRLQHRGGHKERLSTWDRFVAVALAAVWIVASTTAILLSFRRGHWSVLLVGVLGLCYGLLWLRAARTGRRLHWREAPWPWRRR